MPTFVGLVMFVWGAFLFFRMYDAPADALEVMRGRQAVDVALAAFGGPGRDQRAARAARAGRSS